MKFSAQEIKTIPAADFSCRAQVQFFSFKMHC